MSPSVWDISWKLPLCRIGGRGWEQILFPELQLKENQRSFSHVKYLHAGRHTYAELKVVTISLRKPQVALVFAIKAKFHVWIPLTWLVNCQSWLQLPLQKFASLTVQANLFFSPLLHWYFLLSYVLGCALSPDRFGISQSLFLMSFLFLSSH